MQIFKTHCSQQNIKHLIKSASSQQLRYHHFGGVILFFFYIRWLFFFHSSIVLISVTLKSKSHHSMRIAQYLHSSYTHTCEQNAIYNFSIRSFCLMQFYLEKHDGGVVTKNEIYHIIHTVYTRFEYAMEANATYKLLFHTVQRIRELIFEMWIFVRLKCTETWFLAWMNANVKVFVLAAQLEYEMQFSIMFKILHIYAFTLNLPVCSLGNEFISGLKITFEFATFS